MILFQISFAFCRRIAGRAFDFLFIFMHDGRWFFIHYVRELLQLIPAVAAVQIWEI
jgi:hypothetical protein